LYRNGIEDVPHPARVPDARQDSDYVNIDVVAYVRSSSSGPVGLWSVLYAVKEHVNTIVV